MIQNIENLFGDVLVSFETTDQIVHKRGNIWKIGVSLGVLLGVLLGIWQESVSLGLLSVMIGIFYSISHRYLPKIIHVFISDSGIGIDTNFYPYNECKIFGIIWRPQEICMLVIELNNTNKKISIPIPEQVRMSVRTILKKHLPENENAVETQIEIFSRLLKL